MAVMKDSLALDVLHALDLFALERMPDYTFVAITPPPAWITHILSVADAGAPMTLAAAFPYLERFLSQAEAFWREGTGRSMLSGSFVAAGASEELLLRACALNLGPRSVLVLERLRGEADIRQILQKSRENKLQEERLQKKLDALRAPVATISRLVKKLLETDLTAAQRELADGITRSIEGVQSVTAADVSTDSRTTRS
jgi:hypothetical protein